MGLCSNFGHSQHSDKMGSSRCVGSNIRIQTPEHSIFISWIDNSSMDALWIFGSFNAHTRTHSHPIRLWVMNVVHACRVSVETIFGVHTTRRCCCYFFLLFLSINFIRPLGSMIAIHSLHARRSRLLRIPPHFIQVVTISLPIRKIVGKKMCWSGRNAMPNTRAHIRARTHTDSRVGWRGFFLLHFYPCYATRPLSPQNLHAGINGGPKIFMSQTKRTHTQ